MNLDVKIKEIRKMRNISRNKMIRDTGISKRTLKRYEDGKIPFSVKTLAGLADYLDISMDELLGIEPIKTHKEFER